MAIEGNRTLDADDIAGILFLYRGSILPRPVQNLRIIAGLGGSPLWREDAAERYPSL